MALILRGYTALTVQQTHIGARGSCLIPQRYQSAENALWESITGAAALGAQIPYIIPHDHGPDGGGASLPRGCLYSFDVGDDQDAYSHAFTTTTGWTNLEANRAYTFPCYPSPGVDSSNTNVSAGTCYLIAKILAVGTASGGEIRLANGTTGTQSSAATVTTSLTWLTINDIPSKGGTWNKMTLQAQQTSANTNTVRVYALSLHEVRGTSQPESNGTTTYSSL